MLMKEMMMMAICMYALAQVTVENFLRVLTGLPPSLGPNRPAAE